MSAIQNQVIMAFKLLNTALSSRFKSSLNKAWTSNVADCQLNVNVIQGKQTRDLERTLKYHLMDKDDIDKAYEYIHAIAKANKIKLTKALTKGLITDFTIDDYASFKDYIYKTTNAENMFHINQYQQVGRFNSNEVLWEVVDYLVVKNSITSNANNSIFEKLKSTLLKTKPSTFFEGQYNKDFFVSDRYNISYMRDLVAIAIKKTYLSTQAISKDEKLDLDLETFDINYIN
jgi:hypothetical protein